MPQDGSGRLLSIFPQRFAREHLPTSSNFVRGKNPPFTSLVPSLIVVLGHFPQTSQDLAGLHVPRADLCEEGGGGGPVESSRDSPSERYPEVQGQSGGSLGQEKR